MGTTQILEGLPVHLSNQGLIAGAMDGVCPVWIGANHHLSGSCLLPLTGMQKAMASFGDSCVALEEFVRCPRAAANKRYNIYNMTQAMNSVTGVSFCGLRPLAIQCSTVQYRLQARDLLSSNPLFAGGGRCGAFNGNSVTQLKIFAVHEFLAKLVGEAIPRPENKRSNSNTSNNRNHRRGSSSSSSSSSGSSSSSSSNNKYENYHYSSYYCYYWCERTCL